MKPAGGTHPSSTWAKLLRPEFIGHGSNRSLIQFGRKEKRTQTTVQSVEAALALEKKGKRRRIDKRMESGFSFHPFGSFDDGVTSLLSPFLLLSPQLLFLFSFFLSLICLFPFYFGR